MLKSQNDFDFRNNIRYRSVTSAYNRLQIEKPRWSEDFAYGSPFVFAAVKRIHAYLGPRKAFAHLIKGRTLFPPLSSSRKRSARIFVLLLRGGGGGGRGESASKGAAVLCKFMRSPCISRRRRRQFGAPAIRLSDTGGSSFTKSSKSFVETGTRATAVEIQIRSGRNV